MLAPGTTIFTDSTSFSQPAFVATSPLHPHVFMAGGKRKRHTAALTRQMLELVRSGRPQAWLSREYGPSQYTIGSWVKHANRRRFMTSRSGQSSALVHTESA